MSQETEQLGETPEAKIRELVYGSLHPVQAKTLLTELLQEVDEELQRQSSEQSRLIWLQENGLSEDDDESPNEPSPEHQPHKWEDVSDEPFPKESNQ